MAQQQIQTPMDTSTTGSYTHLQVFEANYPRIHMTLASECTTTATALWGKDLISDDLNDKIVDRSGLAASNSEMARAMLNTVHRGLKQEDRQTKWENFIDALKQETIWITKAEKLEATAKENDNDEQIDFPEAAALKTHTDLIADTIQGSFTDLANHLESKGILTLEEKQKFTDPNSRHDVLYTEKMLDEVKKEMKENDEEKVFNVLIKIMKDKGGPPCTLAKQLEGLVKPDIS